MFIQFLCVSWFVFNVCVFYVLCFVLCVLQCVYKHPTSNTNTGVRGGQDQGEEQGFDQEDSVEQHRKEVSSFYLVLL